VVNRVREADRELEELNGFGAIRFVEIFLNIFREEIFEKPNRKLSLRKTLFLSSSTIKFN
jgi:hypothetical protein